MTHRSTHYSCLRLWVVNMTDDIQKPPSAHLWKMTKESKASLDQWSLTSMDQSVIQFWSPLTAYKKSYITCQAVEILDNLKAAVCQDGFCGRQRIQIITHSKIRFSVKEVLSVVLLPTSIKQGSSFSHRQFTHLPADHDKDYSVGSPTFSQHLHAHRTIRYQEMYLESGDTALQSDALADCMFQELSYSYCNTLLILGSCRGTVPGGKWGGGGIIYTLACG